MDKKTKILLGVGVLALVGYYLWKNSQKVNSLKTAETEVDECQIEFMNSPHPDVVRTPEEQDQYQKNWLAECKKRKGL